MVLTLLTFGFLGDDPHRLWKRKRRHTAQMRKKERRKKRRKRSRRVKRIMMKKNLKRLVFFHTSLLSFTLRFTLVDSQPDDVCLSLFFSPTGDWLHHVLLRQWGRVWRRQWWQHGRGHLLMDMTDGWQEGAITKVLTNCLLTIALFMHWSVGRILPYSMAESLQSDTTSVTSTWNWALNPLYVHWISRKGTENYSLIIL